MLKKILSLLFIPLVLFTGTTVADKSQQRDEQIVGVAAPEAQWLRVEKFEGFQTKADPSKISDGGNSNGQNTFINDGDRISIRDEGYDLFGAASSTAEGITTMHTFKKRSGENTEMRTHGQYVDYYDETGDTWEILKTGLTSGKDFGFADYNINTDLHSYTYFGNGSDSFMRWSGAKTNFTSVVNATDVTLNVSDTTDFANSGTLIYCGTEIAYSGKTATTFTVVSAHACASGRSVAQAVDSSASGPKGNIYLVANNRLFISGIASTTQAVYFSKYGDPTDFVGASLVTGSTATSPGIFNLGEGGGGVTGMALDEGSIYIFKKSLIYKATLSDSLYTLGTLKTFDGKSETTGAIGQKSIFVGGNGVFFITPDNQIMNLKRLDNVDYPQIIPISDPIKPTIDSAIFTSSTGITFKDKAYIAARSSSDVAKNDSVFVFNTRLGVWESPIVGWNVGDFTIYDPGTGVNSLHFGDNSSPQSYSVSSAPLDNALGVTANWRSKQFDFGDPIVQKELDSVYIEGYIADNTTISISLMLDENGFTQIYTTNFVGTETSYLFNSPEFNLFGFHSFGFERFGTNDDQSGKKKFRIYLNKDFRRVPFYNAQIEFASDGENQQWEITRFGFLFRTHSQPDKTSLFRSFR